MERSRRKFLQTLAAAPLAATLGGRSWSLLGEPLWSGDPMSFAKPDVIRYDAHCFTIHGRDTFIHSGSFHYSRCPRELWRDRLLKFKRIGFNAIEVYIIWNYHEPVRGQADLSELQDFIAAVQETGLWLIARPGPYACAEWDAGGFPHWVLAKQFPLRSADPESIATSRYWFDLVLPIIRRHQITHGGPIIMMQVENEYDYWPLSDDEKRQYISALAHMAWDAGIEVPLFTCWTKQSRENSYPDMARIMDTCNFYPRWKIFPRVPEALEKLRAEEPESPVGIAELQGGWFSEFGGKLSVDQDGIDAAQLNLLTKTVIEQGVSLYNYYMGFGGTNFDHAAKHITTTYDYAAPIREPGGLWDKTFAARGICSSLNLFGRVLTRAEALTSGCETTQPAVSIIERVNAKSAVVFVRENAGADQQYKMTFVDPASPTHRKITAPREGVLELSAHDMKMFPVQIPIEGGTLRYSTADVLASGKLADRAFLIVYEEPGHLAEIALASERRPHVQGDFQYNYWDDDYDSVVIGVRAGVKEKFLVINDRIILGVVPRARALRTWTAEFPSAAVPDAEGEGPMTVPFISDAALLVETGSGEKRLWADLHFAPGSHEVTILLPAAPRKASIDGEASEISYEGSHRAAHLRLTTPPAPAQAVDLKEIDWWVEKFNPREGEWHAGPLRALDTFGPVPYGYVKYRLENAPIEPSNKIFMKCFGQDPHKVFLNGKPIEELSNDRREAAAQAVPLSNSSTTNVIEISYEAFGSFNFGKELSELMGLKSVKLGAAAETARDAGDWKMQRYALPMRGRAVDPDFSAGGWQRGTVSVGAGANELEPAFTWCRAEFALERPAEEWFSPLKLTFEADRDALIYLNGRFVGRYVTVGPQKDFYLPEPFLEFGKKNLLTFVLAYASEPAPVRTLRVGPYEEFVTRRTRITFEW